MDTTPNNASAEDTHINGPGVGAELAGNTDSDHFKAEEGRVYAGKHLIVDLWGARHTDERDFVDRTLRACVERAGATLLHVHLHNFTPTGLSGVAVLAESHISIHTWPERSYAALDIFMCGDADPDRAVEVLNEAFKPTQTLVQTLYRGEIDAESRPVAAE